MLGGTLIWLHSPQSWGGPRQPSIGSVSLSSLSLALLAQPRFRLLAAARFVSVLGSAFGPIAVSFGVLALPGVTPWDLSLVLACTQAVPQPVFVL